MTSELSSWQSLVIIHMTGQYRMIIRLLKNRDLNEMAVQLAKLLNKVIESCPTAVEDSHKLSQTLCGDSPLKKALKLIIELTIERDCSQYKTKMESLDNLVKSLAEDKSDEDLYHILRIFSRSLTRHAESVCKSMSIANGEQSYNYNRGPKIRLFSYYKEGQENLNESETDEPNKESISILDSNNHIFNIGTQLKRLTIENSLKVLVKTQEKILSGVDIDKVFDSSFESKSTCGSIVIDRSAGIRIKVSKEAMERCKIVIGQSTGIHLIVEDEPQYTKRLANFMVGFVNYKKEHIDTKEAIGYDIFAINV